MISKRQSECMCNLIYIISKRLSIIFIVVMLLVSHICFAFRSTLIRFDPLLSIQSSSVCFGLFQSPLVQLWSFRFISIHFDPFRFIKPIQSSIYIKRKKERKKKKRFTKLTFCDDFRLNKLLVATISA